MGDQPANRPKVIAAIDVGSRLKLPWFRIGASGTRAGADLDDLATALRSDLQSGAQVALGFEAPLWIPRAHASLEIGRARRGEGNRPWSAGAGAAVLAYAVQQATFVLSAIHVGRRTATLDSRRWLDGDVDLLVWEAFVSGSGKDRLAIEPHIDDARRAAEEFARRAETDEIVSDLQPDDVISLVGLAMLISGWADDVSVLQHPAVVVKPTTPP